MTVKINRREARAMPETEARKKWTKENTVHIGAKLQRSTDADILNFLEGKKTQTEVKRALRLLIETESKKPLE